MPEDLLMHPRTKIAVHNYVAKPSHGLILFGVKGNGRYYLARHIAAELLNLPVAKLDTYPYFSIIDNGEESISIEQIRQLQKLLSLRTTGAPKQIIRRVILVRNAEKMGTEAQNAFLKSLEEPPSDTCIIFTAVNSKGLLPTIISRCQSLEVLPVSFNQAEEYFTAKGFNKAEIKKNHALSKGSIGLLYSLLHSQDNDLRSWIDTAKQILQEPGAKRLIRAEELSKDRKGLNNLIDALKRIAHAALISAAQSNNRKGVEKWQQILALNEKSNQALASSANTKLLVDNLLLGL